MVAIRAEDWAGEGAARCAAATCVALGATQNPDDVTA